MEFPNLCFVDTLDNSTRLRKYRATWTTCSGTLSDENVGRIRRQNSRKISVIIGNPPYNANQLNENENNKNREYPEIDKRIKETYIEAEHRAEDKALRHVRALLPVGVRPAGRERHLAFITNRSFIDSRTFDGFREWRPRNSTKSEWWILVATCASNPRLSGTKHNVFGIQTGVAVGFIVQARKNERLQNLLYTKA